MNRPNRTHKAGRPPLDPRGQPNAVQISVRLAPDDEDNLYALMKRYRANQSVTMRRALAFARIGDRHDRS